MKRLAHSVITTVMFAAILYFSAWSNISANNIGEKENKNLIKTETSTSLNGDSLFIAKTCHVCHGNDGKTPLAPIYPKIAGQNLNYVLQQLKDIKTAARDNSQSAAMHGIMQLVSDEELNILAEYVASLPRAEFERQVDKRSLGAKLFRRKTCFTCHGMDGKSPIMDTYPLVAGQSKDYVAQQIRDIKSGVRSNGMTMAMKSVLFMLSDEEVEPLAEYIASLNP